MAIALYTSPAPFSPFLLSSPSSLFSFTFFFPMLYRIPHGPRDRRMLGWFLVGSPISVEFEVDLGRFTSDRLQTDGRLVRNIQIRYNQFELDFWLVS